VKLSRRAWAVIVALMLCGSAAWLAFWQRARFAAASPAAMLQRLPARDAIILFLDFDTLRRGGLLKFLAPSKTPEEPEYQAFMLDTGFDYRRDLDLAAVSFGRDGEFFVIKGRFDWTKLTHYATAQGGTCAKGLCRMPGSTPERRISFFLLQSNLMALAVSTDGFAAAQLEDSRSQAVQPLDRPRDPVWLSIPAETLKTADQLPAGTRLFTTALASADKILLSLGPQQQQFEARLAVTCRSSADAIVLAGQLQHATSLLRETMARENQKPNLTDLSGVLTAGVFEQAGRRVVGRWPLPPVFLESLAGGTL
jgi:hypothetical protein